MDQPRTTTQPSAFGYGISLAASWVATAVMMWRDEVRDAAERAFEGTRDYGRNTPGELSTMLIIITIEVIVATALLGPRKRPTQLRSFCAFVLALVWTALSFVTLMHAGGILVIHFWWMVAITLHCCTAMAIAFRAPVPDEHQLARD